MTFRKGESGNPKGRPKRTRQELDLIEACKLKAPEALRVIANIMRNGENERNRLCAAQVILDRAYGKPIQATVNEHSGLGGSPLIKRSVDDYSDEELLAIATGPQH